MTKVGIGVITCNRPDFFKQCIESIPEVDFIVVVNDGKPYPETIIPTKVDQLIQHSKNLGIAKTKNDAFRSLLNHGCRHIFISEDDIYLKDKEIINRYIKASELSGIGHFNFGYHGPVNKDNKGNPMVRKYVRYDNIEIAFNYRLTGAFSYYRNDVLKNVGFMDERFRNVLEHVDHTYRIIKAGFHPPFYWFADLIESFSAIGELDPELKQSLNKPNGLNYKLRVKLFNYLYKMKNGYLPGNMPDASEEEFLQILEKIKSENISLQ